MSDKGKSQDKQIWDDARENAWNDLGRPGGWAGPATSAAASVAGIPSGGGGRFVMKFKNAEDSEDLTYFISPPWLPTHNGAVRSDHVVRYEITETANEIEGGSIYSVRLFLINAEVRDLRMIFKDWAVLSKWLDAVFPGSAFTASPFEWIGE